MEIPWFDINNSKSLFCKITISDAVATSDLAISDTAFYRHKFASLSTIEEANFPECLTHFFLKLHQPLISYHGDLYYVSIISDRFFGPFRNDSSRFAAQWKQKCCWIDPTRFLFPFGAIR